MHIDFCASVCCEDEAQDSKTEKKTGCNRFRYIKNPASFFFLYLVTNLKADSLAFRKRKRKRHNLIMELLKWIIRKQSYNEAVTEFQEMCGKGVLASSGYFLTPLLCSSRLKMTASWSKQSIKLQSYHLKQSSLSCIRFGWDLSVYITML